MTRVSGHVSFRSPPEQVFHHLEQGVRLHAVAPPPGTSEADGSTLLTRYATKMWFGTVVTTEQATIVPGRSVTWRHVEGPLTGSVETFRIEPNPDGGCLATYEGDIRARHPLFRGLLERVFVAPSTRRVSMGALRSLRAEVDGA